MQSSSQIITTNKPTYGFFTGWMPFLSPNQQCQALNGKYHIPWTCLHQDHLVLPTLSLTTNSSWLPWGRVAMPLISPLMPVPQTLYVDFSEFTVRLQNVFWNTRGKQEKDCNLEKEQCGKCPLHNTPPGYAPDCFKSYFHPFITGLCFWRSLQVRLGPTGLSTKNIIRIAATRLFTGQTAFLSPNQHWRKTKTAPSQSSFVVPKGFPVGKSSSKATKHCAPMIAAHNRDPGLTISSVDWFFSVPWNREHVWSKSDYNF